MRDYLFNPQYVVLLLCSVACFHLSGCAEEGCTDKAALNYNSVAEKDDGSCMYCGHTHEEEQYDLNIFDNNVSSVFYNQAVARVHVIRKKDMFSFDNCG